MDSYEAKVYATLLIAAIILALVIGVFIITIIFHHKKSLSLYKQKIRAEITTLETERRRIATDLHDDLGPLLSAVKLQVSSLEISRQDDVAVLQKVNGHIDVIVNRLREIANDLVPNTLIRKGLIAALDDFTDDINRSGRLQIKTGTYVYDRLPVQTEIHVYRMVQEILNNTLKHSGATVCSLFFKLDGGKLVIDIKDNGKGFDHRQLYRHTGFGLQNILSRVEILGGELFIDTRPGKGVNYRIEIPLDI